MGFFEIMNELIDLDFTIVPTFNIYEASRDLLDFLCFSHGSYGIFGELKKRPGKNYKLWMTFINEYKNRGGRICTVDSGVFIFNLCY